MVLVQCASGALAGATSDGSGLLGLFFSINLAFILLGPERTCTFGVQGMCGQRVEVREVAKLSVRES